MICTLAHYVLDLVTTPFCSVSKLPPRQLVLDAVLNLTKQSDIFWIPHPKFEEADREGPFPAKRLNFKMCHGGKCAAYLLGTECAIQAMYGKIGYNNFLEWLNNDAPLIKKRGFFCQKRKFFMNCCDFVYLSLYDAGLISKEKIVSIYRNQVANELNAKDSTHFYGLDLSRFKNNDSSAQVGDIVLLFKKNVPVHMLFLTGKNPEKGIGLWDQNGFKPSNDDLPPTFKYCSLETALQYM